MGQEFLSEVSAFEVYKLNTKPKNSIGGIQKPKKKNKNKAIKEKVKQNVVKQKQHFIKLETPDGANKTVSIKNKKKKSKELKNLPSAKLNNGIIKQKSILKNDHASGRTVAVENQNTEKKKSKRKQHTHDLEANNTANVDGASKRPESKKLKTSSNELITNNSVQAGMKIFKRILNPIEINKFFEKYWEKDMCFIKKIDGKLFTHLISFESIDRMLRQHHIEFTKNIDITSYKNNVRETLNPVGRALPPDVWNFYNEGCSIRLLNPQTYLPSVYTMNASLQDYFHCMIGANVYLTPPNSQGFAPHYDDIEAFVLQIEGKKRWKVYAPRSKNEILPRYSSHNLSIDEIGTPIFDQILEAGDVLYFPRGYIHQACTVPKHHSLHITLSMYQKQSYSDLFEYALPLALSKCITENVNLRKGLPLNIWRNLGHIHSNSTSKERNDIIKECKNLLKYVIENVPLDDAVDQMAKKYQHDALPPALSQDEATRTVFGKVTLINNEGVAALNCEITLDTNVKLLRGNILRLVKEDNVFRVYYYVDNSREYHEYDANFIEIELDSVPVIEKLIKSYPNYIQIKDIPLNDTEYKISIIQSLWDRGILITEKPFL